MVYLTGDIHGSLEVGRVTDFFKTEAVTKEDYVIILGDAGVCWDGGRNDSQLKYILHDLPLTTLFIDGNHENFDLLNSYPISSWHGGNVHEIEPDIIHLMRGQIFEIEGKTFFTMGGAASTDRISRTEGIDWWPEEMPSEKEYEQGLKALENYADKVDYVLTHTAPSEVVGILAIEMSEAGEPLQQYLQIIADSADIGQWYFGHFHEDIDVEDFYHCLMDRIIRLPE